MRTTRRLQRPRRLTLAALVLAAPPVLGAQPGVPPNDPDCWKVAGTAKVLCSALFVSGRDGTPRNWARLGLLYLRDGVWNGERLLPEGWTRLVSTPAPTWAESSYGGMVWVNARGVWPLPRDAFAFRGAGGQETYVVPSLDLVVVRMGHFPGSRVGGQDLRRALRLIAEALPAGGGGGRQ